MLENGIKRDIAELRTDGTLSIVENTEKNSERQTTVANREAFGRTQMLECDDAEIISSRLEVQFLLREVRRRMLRAIKNTETVILWTL